MKKIVLVFVVLLPVFIGCTKLDNRKEAVMVILKMKDSDYWSQVGESITAECNVKGVDAIVRYTESDADYQSQLDAIAEMEKQNFIYKGIVAVPIYSESNHQVETRIAEVADKYKIPIIIVDTPVNEQTSPLAGKYRTYVGTDNEKAGKTLAENVSADKGNILSVRSKASNASIMRYNGFSSVKGSTDIWETTEMDAIGIEQQLDKYPSATDIVYFNGSLPAYASVLDCLERKGKTAYTFDVFEITLNALIDGKVIKGILAQDTFGMGKQAVDAVFDAGVKNPLYVDPVYITKDNLSSPEVKPFIDYFNGR